MRSIVLPAAFPVMFFCATIATAQTFMNQPPPEGFVPDPPSEQGVCPPSGYAPPVYGTLGDNDGIEQPYEIASPCNSQEVRDVAEAIGMGRTRPITIKNVLTIRFTAKGNLAPPLGTGPDDETTFDMNFLTDSVRLDIETPAAAGKPAQRVVHVLDDGVAWEETTPGVGYAPASPTAVAERRPLLKLNPFGAMLSVIEAEGHATMVKQGDRKIFTGTSPYDNTAVTVTVNSKNLPERVEARANNHVYAATFADYSEDWEPGYFYVFPAHMVWTMDGKPLADLTVTEFKSNPYVVFPRPAPLRSAAK